MRVCVCIQLADVFDLDKCFSHSQKESQRQRERRGDPSITGTRPKRAAQHNSFTLNGCQFFLFI